MDFHSLIRRDLQFLCKRNKIPANITNVAMADALTALEIVEGLDEYMNQSYSIATQSPNSVAKLPPHTAIRTTRRKTTTKAEAQSSSQLVSRSTSKSLAGEMDQENVNKNVAQELMTNNVKYVPKTPAALSTRKASAATSCTKKDELVQSVYSTRRSTRLLEKCMADLSLKTKETLDNIPAKNEDTEQKVSAQENLAGSEAEVTPGRDLSVSMDQVWENLKNNSDKVVGDLEVYVDLGDIAVMDANTETNKEEMNEVTSLEIESENSLVQVNKQEETLQAVCDNDQEIGDLEIYVDLGDTPVLESANTESHNDDNRSKNVLTLDNGSGAEVTPGRDLSVSMEQVWENLKNDSDKVVRDLEVYVDLGDIAVMNANTETNKDEMIEVTTDEKESEDSSVQVNKQEETLQAICEEDPKKKYDNDQEIGDLEIYVDLGDIHVLESANTKTHTDDNGSENVLNFDSPVDQQETEHAIQENDYEPEKINNFDVKTQVDQTYSDAGNPKTEKAIQENDSQPEKSNNFDEDTLVEQTDGDAGDSETEPEEVHSTVDLDSILSEADSNQAVLGSDIADEEMTLSESEGSATTAPHSPPLLEKAEVKTTMLSPFAAESISGQFPRPSKSTTPLKKSALKLANVENKENNMEMIMMNVNNNGNGESKGQEGKKKKVRIDEENLKDVSMRQLVKMVKELSLQTSNRAALQILPGNNQTIE